MSSISFHLFVSSVSSLVFHSFIVVLILLNLFSCYFDTITELLFISLLIFHINAWKYNIFFYINFRICNWMNVLDLSFMWMESWIFRYNIMSSYNSDSSFFPKSDRLIIFLCLTVVAKLMRRGILSADLTEEFISDVVCLSFLCTLLSWMFR